MSFPFDQSVAWRPDPAAVADTNLARFWRAQGLASYADLQAWALADVGRFWDAAIADLGLQFETPYAQVLDASAGIERPQWLVGGRMNIVHNLLDRYAGTPTAARDAIRYESEDGETVTMTYAELSDAVGVCAAGLRAYGLGAGHAVGLLMPMTPELVVAFLAVCKIGGVVLPLFSGYGADAVAQRLADGGAVALVVSDGLPRRGRAVPLKPVADAALAQVPGVTRVFVHNRMGPDALGGAPPMTPGRDIPWSDLVAVGRRAVATDPASARTESTSAEAPVMLIYTSGTTGRPKGAVHTHGGFPVKAAQDLRLPMDVRPGDAVWWMSDMGWMMGPWLVFGTLLCGATMVLYDGAPDAAVGGGTDPGRVWGVCARHGVTLFGLSPSLVRSLMPHGAAPLRAHDLSALRAIGSTGSPWDPESWRWTFETVLGSSRPILNYSGGTEISGGIVCGTFVEPVKPCGFPGPVVGMDADVVADDGQPVREAVGELILRQPWIGMTRGFHTAPADDPLESEARYRDAYWTRHAGVWTHGDFAAVDADGQWFILGRSDDTIKVAGKRLGPAEAENAIVADERVAEAAAVGVPDDVKGEALVLFARLASGAEESEDLRAELSARVAGALGKALTPKAVYFVDALPRTRNAKVMHRVIRAAHTGGDLGNLTALEDPAAVEAIRAAR